MKQKIKSPKKPKLGIEVDKITNGIDYPVFCFKHLQPVNSKCDDKLFRKFLERLQKLQQLGWAEIDKSGRHSFGWEKMPITSIKPQLPSFVTPDVNSLFVFRYTGDNRPFLALRSNNILHVIFIETEFGEIYDHS